MTLRKSDRKVPMAKVPVLVRVRICRGVGESAALTSNSAARQEW